MSYTHRQYGVLRERREYQDMKLGCPKCNNGNVHETNLVLEAGDREAILCLNVDCEHSEQRYEEEDVVKLLRAVNVFNFLSQHQEKLKIVVDLAEQNIIDAEDEDMEAGEAEQRSAVSMAADVLEMLKLAN